MFLGYWYIPYIPIGFVRFCCWCYQLSYPWFWYCWTCWGWRKLEGFSCGWGSWHCSFIVRDMVIQEINYSFWIYFCYFNLLIIFALSKRLNYYLWLIEEIPVSLISWVYQVYQNSIGISMVLYVYCLIATFYYQIIT